MSFLARLYARRIVNVNVNIIAAGALALIPLTLTVHVATHQFGLTSKPGIAVLSFVADLIFDVVIYYALHWLANHSPSWRAPRIEKASQPSFFRDASLIQFERALLSPILYAVAIGLQQLLLDAGYGPTKSTAIGFAFGMATSRTLHTTWMIVKGRTG